MAIESLGDETARAGTDAEERIEPLLTVEVLPSLGRGCADRLHGRTRPRVGAAGQAGSRSRHRSRMRRDRSRPSFSRVLRRRGPRSIRRCPAQVRRERRSAVAVQPATCRAPRARARGPDGVADRLADMTGSAESGPGARKVFAPGMSRGTTGAKTRPVVPTHSASHLARCFTPHPHSGGGPGHGRCSQLDGRAGGRRADCPSRLSRRHPRADALRARARRLARAPSTRRRRRAC